MLAHLGNTALTVLSCACFFCLACSRGAALEHRQSYGRAYSWAFCPTVLWRRVLCQKRRHCCLTAG